jgi:RNA polymerase sigma-70 factor, ECF subfamily
MPGVPDELEAFCANEYGRVFRSLALITGSSDVAAELTQEAFVRLCRDWEKVRSYAAPGAWVHRVAVNLAFSRRRRAGAERRAMDRLRSRPAAGVPTDGGVDVRGALLTLDEAERAVLVLRFFDDLSVDDVARLLDIPVGTVKSRTRRGLEALRSLGLIDEVMVNE